MQPPTKTFIPHHQPLKFYKLVPQAFAPEWGTLHAACFDLRACLVSGTGRTVTVFTNNNQKIDLPISYGKGSTNYPASPDEKDWITINPRQRAMVPTGLTFDIPIGYSLRLHSRSGWAVKQGIVLANHEGIVDSDYVDPTYMVVTNMSDVPATIYHGDKLAQGEMIPDIAYVVEETTTQPVAKSDRTGGFGSTGK